jgi:2-phosphosulfolactate phosphatase
MVLRLLEEQLITFLITGASLGRDGDEDQACGEYIAALIRGENATPNSYTERVYKSTVGKLFLSGESKYLGQEDIKMSIKADLFPFYMSIHCQQGLCIMTREVLF